MKSGSLIVMGFAAALLQATVVTATGAEPRQSGLTVLAQDFPASAPLPPKNAQAFFSFERDLQAAADRGEPDAQWKLGGLYAYGMGVARSDAEALKWYRRAADQFPCGDDRRAGYFVGLIWRGARPAALSSAVIWRKHSMPDSVKAVTPSSPGP